MLRKHYRAGLIGCGDFLRWEIDKINASRHFSVRFCYDLDFGKAVKRASELRAEAIKDADIIFNDPEVDVVLIFTPQFAREEYFIKAAEHKKHIITTKPVALTSQLAKRLMEIAGNRIECAVFYRRSGDPVFEKLHEIFKSGEIGHLGIYKEDWFHHSPHWNNWALDPEKNGGPFMDAMIHNLNISRYLAASKVSDIKFISENYGENISCNDTEFMRVKFENGAGAFLFITWAAQLEIFDLNGNDREHIGLQQIISSQGWFLEITEQNGDRIIRARKGKESKSWKVDELSLTCYDDFCYRIENNLPQNSSIQMAVEDLEILEAGMRSLKK